MEPDFTCGSLVQLLQGCLPSCIMGKLKERNSVSTELVIALCHVAAGSEWAHTVPVCLP